MRNLNLAALAVLLLSVAGCGTSSSTTNSSLSVFAGTWVGPCTATNSTPVAAFKLNYVFSNDGASVNGASVYYGDSSCSTEVARTKIVSSTLIGSTNADGGNNVDSTTGAAIMTPFSASAASAMNSGTVCGKSNWAASAGQDVSSSTCTFGSSPSFTIVFDAAGTKSYSIIKADYTATPATLKVGSSASTVGARPTTYAFTLTKQ